MYHLCKHDRLFIVRWEDTTLQDLRILDGELSSYHRAQGQRLIYISLSDDRTKNPDSSVQRALVDFVDRHQDELEHVYVVLDTKGFAGAAQRAAISSMMMLSGRRGAITVKSSVADAVRASLPTLSAHWSLISAAMERDGIVSREEALDARTRLGE